jgi:hypothetical protein
MVRSAAISWKLGLAVTALALQLWPLPALADDGSAQEVETRPQPLEPKAVPVTLLPPASDTALRTWRPGPANRAPVIMVRPAENTAIAQPRPEPTEPARITVRPAENSAMAQPRPEPAEPARITVRPAENAAIAQPRPEPVEPARITVRPAESAPIAQPRPEPVEPAPITARPAETIATVQPRPEPEQIQEDVRPVETPSSPERPRVAARPPIGNAKIASPRPEPAKTQNDATLVATPSLPGRSPFRQGSFKSEIVDSPASLRQDPEQPKGNAASRFLANLWPGHKAASTPVSSTGGGNLPPASTVSASAPSEQDQAQAGPRNDKPPIKRFLDGIQFWKN